ncbi:aspartate aminotransferase family protein [Leptolyngbya sp. FACHB-261]|nr:aspartate aminotransferase family protein [Leptolyngbya sp. FACHB-261]
MGQDIQPTQAIAEKHREYLWPCVSNYYAEPVVLDRGQGAQVWDVAGQSYLDFFGGILTTSVGHNHPRVTEAVLSQSQKLLHSSTLYPNAPIVDLAEKMAEITPGSLQKSFFSPSGSEANETAIQLAQYATGSLEFLALRHAYSGHTILTTNITAQSTWRQLPSQVPGVKHVANAYCYRCPYGLEYPSCELRCAKDVEQVIQTTTTGQIAGMIAEPIQGVGGFITPPPEYFGIVAETVRNYGGVFISDEVQTGFGRTGGKMFGIEQWGVEPDIMTMAKGVANGLPLGVTIAKAELADRFPGLYVSTFGGNPVSCAAAVATIEVIQVENLADNAATQGALLRSGLESLQQKYPVMGDVRGMGLMQGVEMVTDPKTKEPATKFVVQLFEETKKRGLLIGKGGYYGNVLRITPPLNISKSEVEEALELLDQSLAVLQTGLP